jgi:hypothetical protein
MTRLTQAARLLALLALLPVVVDGFSVGDLLKPFVRRHRARPAPSLPRLFYEPPAHPSL